MEKYVYGTISDKEIKIIVKPVYFGVNYTIELDSKEDFKKMQGAPRYMSLAHLAKMTPRIDKKMRKYCYDIKFMTAQEIKEEAFVSLKDANPWVKIVMNPAYEDLAEKVVKQLQEQIAEIENQNTGLYKIQTILGK